MYSKESFRRSWTLTPAEVLVVAAAIMVLAAILTPISRSVASGPNLDPQLKTLAAAARAYAADNDDRLPLAFSLNTTTGVWRWNFLLQVPAGWRPSTPELRNLEESHAWANSLKPYFLQMGRNAPPACCIGDRHHAAKEGADRLKG